MNKVIDLIDAAKSAMSNSYSPYSCFKVGAALLCNNGKIFTGCNIENVSYGLTICAERTAVFKAISEGYKEFDAIAIYSTSPKIAYPCGACRQVLIEFSQDMKIILSEEISCELLDLIPHPFSPSQMRKDD
jgi:cytidine deaminase